MYVCMYVCIDSSARRPNHTLYTDETTSLSTLRWEMSAPVVTFGTTLKNSVFAWDIPKSDPIFVDRRGGWFFVCRACQQKSAPMRALPKRNCNFWPRSSKRVQKSGSGGLVRPIRNSLTKSMVLKPSAAKSGSANKKFVNKKYGFEAFSRQIWFGQ